jgi:hypothetical protein
MGSRTTDLRQGETSVNRLYSLLVVVALVASLASLTSAGQAETASASSWSVRVIYSALASRLGNPPAVLEYTVEEYGEPNISTARAAVRRAQDIADHGFSYEFEGRLIVVPPSRIELVEVYALTEGAEAERR